MTLWVLGLNHQTAPVSLRERIALRGAAAIAAVTALNQVPQTQGTVLLSTCNRTELYAQTDRPDLLMEWIAEQAPELDTHWYQYCDAQAIRHLFRVASGLDSMVLGEPQILGQVKEAWSLARQYGRLGQQLDHAFQQCFAVAKRIRTDTSIGANPVTIASTAVRLAQQSFAQLKTSTVMLIGAGETIELTAKHLREGCVNRLLIANRTLAHAQTLTTRYGGDALSLSQLDRHLADADIVFAATNAPEPIVLKDQVKRALQQRRCRPMLLFDLAVPRNLEATIGTLADAYLYTLDDLEEAVAENRQHRRHAAEIAETMIELSVQRYQQNAQASRRQGPLKRLKNFGDTTRDELLARAQHQLAHGKPATEVLTYLANTLTNRLLHPHVMALREAALNNDADLMRASDQMYSQISEPAHDASLIATEQNDDSNATP